MQEVYAFLKECKTYYLATADGDQPHIRPFGTVDIFDGGLYIQTGKVKDVAKQIFKNPKIEICAFSGKQWLRLTAKAYEDDRYEAKDHMLDAYPHLRAIYDPGDGNTLVLRLKEATATFYTMGGGAEPKTVKFGW